MAPASAGRLLPGRTGGDMRRSIRGLMIVALSILVTTGAVLTDAPPQARAASGDKRPNLRMLPLRDWHIQNVNGRRLLRFTSIFVNAGPGAFEVRGNRSSSSDPTMGIRQRMFRWDGTSRYINTKAFAMYAADGHDHWHVHGVTVYEAWKESDPVATRRGAKTGFCFLDSEPWNLSLPGARQAPVYRGQGCGVRASLSLRTGLSVGWADNYPWNFAFQWIDITGLPGGIYRVRVTVDIQNYYDETNETDGCVWAKIRIPAPGSNRAPTVYANGSDCGYAAMTPVSSFANGVTWSPGEQVSIAPGTYTGRRFNSVGTSLATKQSTVRNERIVTATARAIPPGVSGRWLYMTNGPFAGWWLKQGDGVKLVD
jgi:hypothetical protein